jgi:hypothetical protein
MAKTDNLNIKDLKEARNLLNEIKDTVHNIKQGYENANTSQKKGLKDYQAILENILADEKLDRLNKLKRASLIDELVKGNASLSDIAKKRADIQRKMIDGRVKENGNAWKGYKVDLKMLDVAEGRLKTQKLIDAGFEAGDELTGGMLSKAKGLKDTMGQFGTKTGLAAAGLAAAAAILISFSGKLDTIGQQFGAIGMQSGAIKGDILAAEVEATKLGKTIEDVINVTRALTDEFGVAFSEARNITSGIIDTSVALGLSVDEGAKLVGVLSTVGQLTTDTAQALAKQVTLLATANDVAPQSVLRDIANSAETIALYTDRSGNNIARAAIQAKRLGTSLQEIAGSLRQTLDFDTSIRGELEASVLLGRQLNLQRVRELTLANDLEGAQNALVRQLGSSAEFGRLNVIQKEALARATGLSAEQMAKFVSNEKDAVTLAGQLAGQPGFDKLVGKNAISDLTMMNNQLKSMAALLVNILGPAINLIFSILNPLLGLIEQILSPLNSMIRSDNQSFVGAGMGAIEPIGLATGGLVMKPVNANLAENGPEAVIPLTGSNKPGDLFDTTPIVTAISDLKSEMRSVNSKISNLKLSTKLTNREINVVLTPHST